MWTTQLLGCGNCPKLIIGGAKRIGVNSHWICGWGRFFHGDFGSLNLFNLFRLFPGTLKAQRGNYKGWGKFLGIGAVFKPRIWAPPIWGWPGFPPFGSRQGNSGGGDHRGGGSPPHWGRGGPFVFFSLSGGAP